jgi:hypothetical protein
MSQTALIPTFAATTLLGSFNELSVWLTLVGILGIILHTAITPTGPPGSYPNFDNYSDPQPPFQDLVLVFGLANLVLVALFSRVRPLVGGLILFIYTTADFSLPYLALGSRSVPPQVAGASFPHSHV